MADFIDVNINMMNSAPAIDEHYPSKVNTVVREHPMVTHNYTENDYTSTDVGPRRCSEM